MQIQIEKLLQQISDRLVQLSNWIVQLSHQLLIWLQKAWSWYQSIDWPEIPLTPIQWVLLFYFIFGLAYMWATPVFEASDELWHFGMVEYIRENGELPVHDVRDPERIFENNRDTIYRQEGSQPPLYYWLASILISPLDISDSDQFREMNPHAKVGMPGSFGNKNMVLHPVDAPPMQGTVLAVYWLRTAGLLMGLGAIWSVYRAGQLIMPHRPIAGLVAAVITAFNPMFIFISASVNNDNLVILLDAFAILLALYMLRDGFEWKRSLAIALLVALAALTKLSALVLVPVIALGALWVAWRDKSWRGLIFLGVAMFVAWAAIAGWWYVRNLNLYGELFGTMTMAQVAGVRSDPLTIGALLSEFQGFRLSYWGVFGAFNIQTTAIFYALVDFVVFISLFGVAFLVAQLVAIRDFSYARRELTYLLFLLGITLVGLIAFIGWTSQTLATQGRLLFPFLGAISPLLAAGFVEVAWWLLFLLSPPDRSFVRAGEAVPEAALKQSLQWPIRILGILAFLIPFWTIAPQYVAPSPLNQLPSDAVRVFADYGAVKLVGYEHSDRRYSPGEAVRVTLYWQVAEQTQDDHSLALGLVTTNGDALGSLDTYPGAGTLRTSRWEAGKIYPDTYQLTLSRAVSGRLPFQMQIAWYESNPQDTLPISDDNDNELETVLLDIGALIAPGLQAETVPDMAAVDSEILPEAREFGGLIRPVGFSHARETDDSLIVLLQWETRGAMNIDYTTFAHVINDEGELVGQADVFPQLPTRYWRFGETFVTDHIIEFISDELPEGVYRVLTGWYENDGEEFPRLKIQPETEDEADSFEVFTFSVDEDGTFHLPELPNQDEETPDAELAPIPQENDPFDVDSAPDVGELEEEANDPDGESSELDPSPVEVPESIEGSSID